MRVLVCSCAECMKLPLAKRKRSEVDRPRKLRVDRLHDTTVIEWQARDGASEGRLIISETELPRLIEALTRVLVSR